MIKYSLKLWFNRRSGTWWHTLPASYNGPEAKRGCIDTGYVNRPALAKKLASRGLFIDDRYRDKITGSTVIVYDPDRLTAAR